MNADEFDESAFSYQLPLGDAGQLVRGAARDGRVLRLNGDPEDRLGAGRTDQQAAGGPERRLGALLRRAEDIVRLPLAPTSGLHVARHLRPERHFVGKVRERATLRARKVKHLERREDAVARRGVLAEDDVAGGLAAELGAKPFHGFPDIAIADLRALEADTVVSEHRLEAAVRHHRADHDLWVELSVTHEVTRRERQDEIAVVRAVIEELDAVVRCRVVRCADDRPGYELIGLREECEPRCRNMPDQAYLHAHRAEPGGKRALQHPATPARVPPDHDRVPRSTQDVACSPAEPKRELRAQIEIRAAADAVGTEEPRQAIPDYLVRMVSVTRVGCTVWAVVPGGVRTSTSTG